MSHKANNGSSNQDPGLANNIELPPVVILAGGLATRLHPITLTMPKSMISIAGKPFIDYQLKYLASQNIKQVILCVGHLADTLVNFVGDGRQYGLQIIFSFDGSKLLGTGGAIKQALKKFPQEIFFVTYGDSFLTCKYSDVFKAFKSDNYDGQMSLFHNKGRWDKSNVVFRDGQLKIYDKKNLIPDMEYIDYGLSILKKQVFNAWPNDTAFDLADLFSGLVKTGKMAGFEVLDRFYEIGSTAGIVEAEQFFANH